MIEDLSGKNLLVIPAGITILSSNYFILSGLFSSYVYLIFLHLFSFLLINYYLKHTNNSTVDDECSRGHEQNN